MKFKFWQKQKSSRDRDREEPTQNFFFCKGLNQRRWLTDWCIKLFLSTIFDNFLRKEKKVKKTFFEQIKLNKNIKC